MCGDEEEITRFNDFILLSRRLPLQFRIWLSATLNSGVVLHPHCSREQRRIGKSILVEDLVNSQA